MDNTENKDLLSLTDISDELIEDLARREQEKYENAYDCIDATYHHYW